MSAAEPKASLERLDAVEQIRQCAARYSRGVDRLDVATMQSAYWPDGTDDHGVFVGNAMEFCERVVSTHGRFLATMHCVLNHWIELDDDLRHGRGEVYNVTYLHRVDGEQEIIDTWWGRYLDRYERRGDEWRIIHRTCVHEMTRSDPVDAHMPINAAAFTQGSADRLLTGG
jgi:ketosteroid isomerase-like protein